MVSFVPDTHYYDLLLLTDGQRWAGVVYSWIIALLSTGIYFAYCTVLIKYSPKEMVAYKW